MSLLSVGDCAVCQSVPMTVCLPLFFLDRQERYSSLEIPKTKRKEIQTAQNLFVLLQNTLFLIF